MAKEVYELSEAGENDISDISNSSDISEISETEDDGPEAPLRNTSTQADVAATDNIQKSYEMVRGIFKVTNAGAGEPAEDDIDLLSRAGTCSGRLTTTWNLRPVSQRK